jgi:dephospho-CoA kinase
MQIFILNGMAQSGKDTFYNMVSEMKKDETFHFSIIDKVKEKAKLLGWTGEKTEKDRAFLHNLKILMDNYNDFNFEYVKTLIDLNNESRNPYSFIFIDMREEKDIIRAKKEFNAKTILIKNDNAKNILSNNADANVFNMKYDIIIDNSGTLDDLRLKVKQFIKEYIEV